MQMFLGAFDPITDVLIVDWSDKVVSCSIRSGEHGNESLEVVLHIPFLEAVRYYAQLGPFRLRCVWGAYQVWVGRIEDPSQFTDVESGLKIVAFGQWVALNDIPYTALWSTTKYDNFIPANQLNNALFVPERWEFSTQNNSLYIAPRKGETFNNVNHFGALSFQTPSSSNKTIVGVEFDVSFTAPLNWSFRLQSHNRDFSGGVNQYILVGNGANQTRRVHLTWAGQDRVTFVVFNNTGGNVVKATDTGVDFARITNLRIVADLTYRINTTLTANRNAGANVTATVGSTVGMYIGQRLTMNTTNNPSESVVVLSIGSATQFNATFANNYTIGQAVNAHIIYPDSIIKDCVAFVNGINPSQLSANVSQIQSQAIDIDEAIYEDMYPTEIINGLIQRGDNQEPPRQWVAMVNSYDSLVIQPRGSGRDWFTDVLTFEIVRSLVEMYNSVYAVYSDGNNFALRSSIAVNAASITKLGLTRRKAVTVETTIAVQAETTRDTILALEQDPIPRTSITLERVFDVYGTERMLFEPQADDTLTLRNLTPAFGLVYDKIKTLVISRTDYNPLENTLTLELELPIPALDVQIAKALAKR